MSNSRAFTPFIMASSPGDVAVVEAGAGLHLKNWASCRRSISYARTVQPRWTSKSTISTRKDSAASRGAEETSG
jgi:hypothetical protein